MIQQYKKIMDNIIWDILDEKVRECEATNKDVIEQRGLLRCIDKQFDDIMLTLDERKREVLDSYLSTRNYIQGLIQYDLYRQGIIDGIQLLKDLKVI